MNDTRELLNFLKHSLKSYKETERKALARGLNRILIPTKIDYETLKYFVIKPENCQNKENIFIENFYFQSDNLEKNMNYVVVDLLKDRIVDLINHQGNSLIPEEEKNGFHICLCGKRSLEEKLKLLYKEIGNFLLVDERGIPYGRCKCKISSFQIEIYLTEEKAREKREHLIKTGQIGEESKVEEINESFIRQFSNMFKPSYNIQNN